MWTSVQKSETRRREAWGETREIHQRKKVLWFRIVREPLYKPEGELAAPGRISHFSLCFLTFSLSASRALFL